MFQVSWCCLPCLRYLAQGRLLTQKQVIVISFYHNEAARITQMCWNGEGYPITFRQSRLVNIASQSFDTPEILLLLRWMSCVPLQKPKVSRRRLGSNVPAAALEPRLPVTTMRDGSAEPSNRADGPMVVREESTRRNEPHPDRKSLNREVLGSDSASSLDPHS
jgi:hypothetical protein